jgi:hypothetical protein
MLADIESGNLVDAICGNRKRDISVSMNTCAVGDNCTAGTQNLKFVLKNAELESQNFTSSIGANKTVDLTFVGQIGGPQDTTDGVFVTATAAVRGTQTVDYGARTPDLPMSRAHPGLAFVALTPAKPGIKLISKNPRIVGGFLLCNSVT